MKKKLLKAVSQFSMLRGGERVTVALSGGADSVALLNLLFELKDELNITLTAAHFNHKIRGAEADRDQDFAACFCKKLDIPIFVGNADVLQFAEDNGLSVELAARKLRYEFFESLDTDIIATAHTASDNVETVLFNITRGSALGGLCGIPPVRDQYIRPLIFCSREDVEKYCKEKALSFVTDSTNLCDDYTRNSIRHNVIPYLKKINPSIEQSISRTTVSLAEDAAFLEDTAYKVYKSAKSNDRLILKEFIELPAAVAKRVLKYYCEEIGVAVDNFHLNEIYSICINGGKTGISGNNSAISDGNNLVIVSNKPQNNVAFKLAISIKDNNLFENDEKVHNLLLKNAFDCDKIVGKLVQRTRQSGDTMRLANKNCTKSLKKLFTEYKIPLDIRNCLPVISDDKGIVWVYNIGVADRCAVRKESKKIYSVDVQTIFLGDNYE